VSATEVLLIEDESAIADTVVYALETEGYGVRWTQTGTAGLAAFADGSPALVILDIGLPDMNGFDLCRQIRARSEVPIVFLTARSDEIDRIVGLEIGGDDYVVKPFSPRELTARIRAILRRGRLGADASGPDEFEVDAQAQRIRFRGEDLGLSRYEYRLLRILLAHPGRVYSREQLMQMAWEEPERSLDRTVDTHIKTLRAKIRAVDGQFDPIRTRRGIGYAFEPGPPRTG
jgi:two-component system catabolic regulation response regulator CreB